MSSLFRYVPSSGHLIIYNWEEQLSVKSFEVCSGTAVRCAKFIPQKEVSEGCCYVVNVQYVNLIF